MNILLKRILILSIFVGGLWTLSYVYIWKGQDRSRILSILAWQGSFTREVIDRFEKETGIRVHLTYYATNEELLAKLYLTKGRGIDLLVPSDYAVKHLADKGFTQPLERGRIKDLPYLYKKLVDPVIYEGYLYALPLEWGVYGVGAHPAWIKNNPYTDPFRAFFFPGESSKEKVRLCMTNDAPAACMAVYLYGENHKQGGDRYKEILDFLIMQRDYVVAYGDNRIGHMFAAGEIDLAYMQTDEFLRTLVHLPHIRFYLDPRRALKTVEYAALSAQSEHVNEAYEFLNFILRKDVMECNMSQLCYLPVRSDLENSAVLQETAHQVLRFVNAEEYELVSAFDVLPEKDRLKLWVCLKSKN